MKPDEVRPKPTLPANLTEASSAERLHLLWLAAGPRAFPCGRGSVSRLVERALACNGGFSLRPDRSPGCKLKLAPPEASAAGPVVAVQGAALSRVAVKVALPEATVAPPLFVSVKLLVPLPEAEPVRFIEPEMV